MGEKFVILEFHIQKNIFKNENKNISKQTKSERIHCQQIWTNKKY